MVCYECVVMYMCLYSRDCVYVFVNVLFSKSFNDVLLWMCCLLLVLTRAAGAKGYTGRVFVCGYELLRFYECVVMAVEYRMQNILFIPFGEITVSTHGVSRPAL